MGSLQDIAAKPRLGITPEQNRDSRVRAWVFAFECYRMKKGSAPGAPDDGTESKEDSADELKYTA